VTDVEQLERIRRFPFSEQGKQPDGVGGNSSPSKFLNWLQIGVKGELYPEGDEMGAIEVKFLKTSSL